MRRAFPYLALLILTAAVYANTLSNQFIWDDKILIVDNYQIQSVHLIPSLFTQPFFNAHDDPMLGVSYYRPLISLSYAIEYALWGLRPLGYHITNIAAHCVTVLLFFHFFRLIMRENSPSPPLEKGDKGRFDDPVLIAAFLYAVNPVHTNAVSYIAGRTDLFAASLFLGSLILYRSFRHSQGSGGGRRLFGASVLFGLALFCKEAAVMLPFVVVMYDVCFTERFKSGFKWGALAAYVPFAVVLALYFSFRATAVEGGAGFAIHSASDMVYRVATIIKSVVLYWKLLLFPFGLSYDRDVAVVRSLTEPSFLASLAILCGSVFLLVRWWSRDKSRFFLLMWFFILFGPVSNLLPIFPTIAHERLYTGEHYVYLPSMALFVLIATFLPLTQAKTGGSGENTRRRWLPAALLLIVFQFSVLTIRRNRDWRDEQSFYTGALKGDPQSVRIINNLGILYLEQKQYQKASALFESALKIQPDSAHILVNLGILYKEQGQYEKALETLDAALRSQPDSVSALSNIAEIYQKIGLKKQAEQTYLKVIALDEKNLRGRYEFGELLEEAGRLDEAKKHFALLIQWFPSFSPAHHEMGRILVMEGNYGEAIEEFRKALEGETNRDVVLNSMGIAYARRGDLTQAAERFRQAIKANPNSFQAHVNLGNIYYSQNIIGKAIEEYEKALEIEPNLPPIRQRVQQLRGH